MENKTCGYVLGCKKLAVEGLVFPDGTPAYVCEDHMHDAGFCSWCNGYFGGVEDFHFGWPPGFCYDCRQELIAETEGEGYDDGKM